jgi:hypothetical protein
MSGSMARYGKFYHAKKVVALPAWSAPATGGPLKIIGFTPMPPLTERGLCRPQAGEHLR